MTRMITAPTIQTRLLAIPDGPEGIRQTLLRMRDFVRAGKISPPVYLLARELLREVPHKNWKAQIAALHAFVRDEITYVKDPTDIEAVQTPEKTLEIGTGDCDDKSTLLAALLESVNHPTRFVALAFSPDAFSHVLTETRIGASWIPAETTERVPLGWYPPRNPQRMVIHN